VSRVCDITHWERFSDFVKNPNFSYVYFSSNAGTLKRLFAVIKGQSLYFGPSIAEVPVLYVKRLHGVPILLA